MIKADKATSQIQQYIVDYSSDYAEKKLLSGKKLTELASKKYVDDISKAFNEMLLIYYLYGRLKINDILRAEIAKYDKKEADKIIFKQIQVKIPGEDEIINIKDYIGKQYRPNDAINNLLNQLEIREGDIYKTRLNKEQLLEKARKIGILSYSDFVNRVNTKLAVALDSGQPYSQFIKLLKADGVPGLKLNDLVKMDGYWLTTFRTNSASIFNLGYLDQRDEVKEFIEYEQFTSVFQIHPQCQELNGAVKPTGWFEEMGLIPPIFYNCSSYITAISKVRAEALNIKPTPGKNNIKANEGFGKVTTRTACNLPKSTESRLPKGYKKLL